MQKLIGTCLVCLSMACIGEAQEVSATDLSRYELFEENEKVQTLSELEVMEDAYLKLVSEDKCFEALPKISEFSEAANRVANIVKQGNEPYYDARRDDQEAIARNRSLINELISAEKVQNKLISQRNRAWVEEAKCLLSVGDREAAITRLFRALDFISGDERKLWEEARTLLWAEIGFAVER